MVARALDASAAHATDRMHCSCTHHRTWANWTWRWRWRKPGCASSRSDRLAATATPAVWCASAAILTCASWCPMYCGLQFEWLGEDDPLSRTGAKPSREIKVEQVREATEWTQRSASSARGPRAGVVPGGGHQPDRGQCAAQDAGRAARAPAHRDGGWRPGTPAAHAAQPRAARARIAAPEASAGIGMAEARKAWRRRAVHSRWPAAARWRRWRCTKRASTRLRSTCCLARWRAATRKRCWASRCRW